MSGTSVAPGCMVSSKDKDADHAVRAQLCIADVFPFPAREPQPWGQQCSSPRLPAWSQVLLHFQQRGISARRPPSAVTGLWNIKGRSGTIKGGLPEVLVGPGRDVRTER